jgi:prepilin peptidase CpaA
MALDYLTAALLTLTAIAAVTDSRSGLIPNWLTLPVLALAPLLQLAQGGSAALARSLIGVLVCAAIPLCLFRAGAMGGGDVKLLGAIGGLLGPLAGLELQLLAYNVLVLFACVVLACRRQLLLVLRRALRLLGPRGRGESTTQPATTFRLGLPIFVSALTLLAIEAAR